MSAYPQVAVIGECMVELQKSGELYKQTFGGDTLNTALYLSRLTKDHSVITRYITGLGKDPFSQQMLNSWQQEGINTEEVFISDKHLPGMYLIETAADGERRFSIGEIMPRQNFGLMQCALIKTAKPTHSKF